MPYSDSSANVLEPDAPDGVLLIAEKDANETAFEGEIAHEKTRAASTLATIHFDSDMVAIDWHRDVDVDEVGSLRNCPVQGVNCIVCCSSAGVEDYVSKADIEVVGGLDACRKSDVVKGVASRGATHQNRIHR